jgi:hypothetical protein
LQQEVVRGGEEQRPVQAVRDDVLVEQGLLLGVAVAGVDRHAFETGRAGNRAQSQHDRDADAGGHRRHQIEEDGDSEGEHQHDRIAAGRTDQGEQRCSLDHPDRGGKQDSGQRGHGDSGHQRRGQQDHACQGDGVGERGELGACAGAHADRGAGDRGRGGHATQDGRDQVRDALAEQFPVGLVAFVDAHRVGDRRRQQALQRRQRCDRARGGKQPG